ncbi:hypothetical protein [Streptomyces sp. NPDC051576]|uniref:hypothetical protein n=1 Tax=Streptomyces sp. NPDC051576 TaxID=3155803 RepID=UPI0034232D02
MRMAGRWHGCFDTFNGVVLMALVTLPLAALMVWALAHRRPWRMSLAEVGMVHETVPFILLTMMPGGHSGADTPVGESLVPLRDLVAMGPGEIGGTCWSSRR